MMEEDQKFKIMMIGTAVLFVIILVYVGAGSTGFITMGTGDENALSISDFNVLLKECRVEISTLIATGIAQSNTIDNVNDLLNKSRNQTDQLDIDLNNCTDDLNTEVGKWQDLNSQLYDLNTARQLCKNNLNNAINLKIECEENRTDLNTTLYNANQNIIKLEDDLDEWKGKFTQCNDDKGIFAGIIDGLTATITTLNTTITDLNSDVNSLTTLNTALDLNLSQTKDYMYDLNNEIYNCDVNAWWWC